MKPILEELLVNLFEAFEIRGSEENEYIMKGKTKAMFFTVGGLLCFSQGGGGGSHPRSFA